MTTNHDGTLERLFEFATLLTDLLDRGLEQQGLSRPRAEVLWRIHHHGPTTQRQLADSLQCTPRNVTGLVDALDALGLVERQRHPSDRRAVLVALTPTGRRTVDNLLAAYRSRASELLDGISGPQLTSFLATLAQVADRLRPDSRPPPVDGSPRLAR
ncbi:MarR family winged helix-turn-helix transcriptional regulator [Phytoactinopolyspora limicola]|uniref:MarR family winged helix-turn-helix transcriptional regulator n=1 Tax=Phytoactinopolyspora limicola TaxID=2715536 RepID=UPI00140E2E55|nr:MarR family transcriptional regulator [Phytoactinopolyspora limicola]